MQSNGLTFSLEVFPPKTEEGVGRLLDVVDSFVEFRPDFLTVTSGAGGSTDTAVYTCTIAQRIASHAPVRVAGHVTCANRSKADVDHVIDLYWQQGVRHILALRGDMMGSDVPYVPHPQGYAYSYDFVEATKKRYPSMVVAVAGYPETHPESSSEIADMEHLKRKVDAGADAVLSQFFFDPDVFLRWRDRLVAMGVQVPIVPGLLPVLDFNKAQNMAKKCNASIPPFLRAMFEGVAPDSIDHKLLAMNVLSHQITRLIGEDVKFFHFYTMNDTLLTRHLCTWLRSGF